MVWVETGGGKISYFTSALTGTGKGALVKREGVSVYEGGDKERELYIPSKEEKTKKIYKDIATKAAEKHVSIDVYSLSDSYLDLSTLSLLTVETGGSIERFPGISRRDAVDSARLMEALERNIVSTVALDSIFKCRVSNGFREKLSYGPGHQPMEGQEYFLASFPSHTSIMLELEHDGSNISNESYTYIQCAVLYTTLAGEKRLRVHNLSLKLTATLADIFRHADIDAVTNYLSRKATISMLRKTLAAVKEDLTVAAVNMLSAYRKHCAKNPSMQQLILPEALKLLPLYVLAIKKSKLLRSNKPEFYRAECNSGFNPALQKTVRADTRAVVRAFVCRASVQDWIRYIYPNMAALNCTLDGSRIPAAPTEYLAPASHSLDSSSIYFLSNGFNHVLYIGENASGDTVQQLTGGKDADAANQAGVSVSITTDPESIASSSGHPKSLLYRMMRTVAGIHRKETGHILESIRVVKQGSPIDCMFSRLLVEDKQAELNYMIGYDDYLVKMHSLIKREMSK